MKKLWKYNRRPLVYFFFLLSFIRTILALFLPYTSGLFIDTIRLKNWQLFIQFAVIILLLNLSYQIFEYYCDRLSGKLDSHIWRTVTRETQQNLQSYDMKMSDLSVSTIMQQLGQNFELLSPFFYSYPIHIVLYALRAVIILAILATMSWQLTLMVGILIPIFIFVSERYAQRLSDYNQYVVDNMKDQRDYLADTSRLSKMIRFFGGTPLREFTSLEKEYSKNKEAQVKVTSFFENFLSYSFLNAMIVLASIVSAYQVFTDQITIGQYFAIQLYVSQFWSPIEYFLTAYQDYIAKSSIIDSFITFLNPELTTYVTSPIDRILLKDYVSLGRDHLALHKPVNASLEKGEIYLIRGKNGIGKTRLIEALLGFHSFYQGNITYNNFAQNLNLAYCPADPIPSRFYKDLISQGASMGQLKLHQLEEVFSEDKDVYIFDEPTNFLDESHKHMVTSKITEIANQDAIVILISHDTDLWNLATDVIDLD